MIDSKWCPGCKTSKHVSDFFKNASRIDGLQTTCKSCRLNYQKKYRDSSNSDELNFGSSNSDELNFGSSNSDEPKKKKCVKCGIEKETALFHKDSMLFDGLRRICKECIRKYDKTRRKEKKLKAYKELVGYVEVDKTIPAHIDLSSLKACSICKEDKPLKEFYYNARTQLFNSQCRTCAKVSKRKSYEKREIEKLQEMRKRSGLIK